ncbi:DUF4434 domain-containing protein [Pararhodonellum marinum]|uniref:DUF4434 domain-containing protein n=1 Tax=Pararhodonellum marinum TaxID=2755358 RepID=UPI0018902EDF|nr:DUF4434 domain-containing protein [Pararhodonellum marinum]
MITIWLKVINYFNRKRNINLVFLFWFMCISACQKPEPFQRERTVEVRYIDGKAQLFRHGAPFFIKGASGYEHMDRIAAYGGNSIRTWSLHDAQEILDEAHQYGLTVTLGLEIGRPYWGKDFNYWNIWKINEQVEALRPVIEKYKDHPALLMWGVGNEVELQGGGKRPLIYHAINRVAKMVKEIDPNHPVMTAVNPPTNPNRFASFSHVLTHVDILGYNAFDKLPNIYEEGKIYGKKGWGKAYILSEWGPPGHWESKDTDWGAPLELDNKSKTDRMREYWKMMHQDSLLFLGNYAFYWGHKQEITHTWFSMFSEEGFETESVNFLRTAWSGEAPGNWAPRIEQIAIQGQPELENMVLFADSIYTATIFASDPEGDQLTFRWELRPEEQSFYEKGAFSYNMKYLMETMDEATLNFKAPQEEGDYRLFAFVFDGNGNVASHNIPFYVVPR